MMQINTFKITIGTLLFLVLIFSQTAFGQSDAKEDLTIDEYFQLLTNEQYPIFAKFKNRESLAKDVDYPNRYILLANEEWNGWGEMVLFEKKSGGYLFAATQYGCTKKYPYYPYYYHSQCNGTLKFFELSGNKLSEVKDVLTDVYTLNLYDKYKKKTGRLADSENKLLFELPKERSDIQVKLNGEPLYSFVWNGEKFEGNYIK